MANLVSADSVSQAITFIESSLTVDRNGPSAGEEALLDIKIECSEWTSTVSDDGCSMAGSLVFGLDARMTSDSTDPRELMKAAMRTLVSSSCPIEGSDAAAAERRMLESAISLAYGACRDRIFLLSSTSPMGTLLLQDVDISQIVEDVLTEAHQGTEGQRRD